MLILRPFQPFVYQRDSLQSYSSSCEEPYSSQNRYAPGTSWARVSPISKQVWFLPHLERPDLTSPHPTPPTRVGKPTHPLSIGPRSWGRRCWRRMDFLTPSFPLSFKSDSVGVPGKSTAQPAPPTFTGKYTASRLFSAEFVFQRTTWIRI